MIVLDVRNLKDYSSSSRAKLSLCSESAAVTLWRFHTPPRTEGKWLHRDHANEQANRSDDTTVVWNEPSMQLLETYGNAKEATEMGAYAVALAVADQLGFTVLGRAGQTSGSDWIMIRKGEPSNDYYRLEVSGMAAIGQEKPEQRLARKVEQLRAGDLQRPGIAIVVRFEDVRIVSEVAP